MLQTLLLKVRLNGIIISIERRLHKLINNTKSKEELSAIERSIIRYETENSEVMRPVVRRIIPPRKVLMVAYTMKQIRGYNSVIFNGTNR